MTAVVCRKRSFFEDFDPVSPLLSQPAYKRFRYSSPVRFSPVDRLKALFPDTEIQLLDKALEEAGYDIASAINTLNNLHLGYAKQNSSLASEEHLDIEKGAASSEKPQPQNNLPVDGAAWVDLIVKEMMSATSVDDAKSRAASVLESLEKTITSSANNAGVAEGYHKENMMLKEQNEALLRDNAILKRAVAIQHERQKVYDERSQEEVQMKQLVGKYQEQLRTLEMNNYALSLHLKQALQGNSILGHFNRDVF